MIKKPFRVLNLSFVLLIIMSLPIPAGQTAAFPELDWPTIALEQVVDGLQSPVFLTHAGDGRGRIFVVEQPGRIRILKSGVLQNTPFLDITDRVSSQGSEEGLLSMAFPPGFAIKGYFYVYYTRGDGNNVVARFHTSTDPDQADPGSEELILLLEHPRHANHNGGQLAFGPDGYLYITTGDGGGGGDPDENGQNPASLLGKLLRIDVEFNGDLVPQAAHKLYLPVVIKAGDAPVSRPYRIPADNPFVGVSGYREEIWALGLRNPWRASFDRSNGDLYTADVGQVSWEEVNVQSASSAGGENYGWNIMEGMHCYNSATCDQSGLTLPVVEYSHTLGCSITGGYVYRGQAYPALQGIYLYGDYCSGRIWGLQRQGEAWQSSELLSSGYNVSSFGEDQAGELYLLSYYSGEVYRVTGGTN